MPAPGVILLLSNSSTRIQGIKTFGKVYKNIFPLHNLLLSDFKFYICLSGVTQGSLFYCTIPLLEERNWLIHKRCLHSPIQTEVNV